MEDKVFHYPILGEADPGGLGVCPQETYSAINVRGNQV
jgi:hypothetical protein